MRFLKVLNRYLLVQLKMINLKGIALAGFVIPVFFIASTLAYNSPFNNASGRRNLQLAKESGFADWYGETWTYLSNIVKSFLGYDDALTVMILSSLLFGAIAWLLMTHLFYLVFELAVFLQFKFNRTMNFQNKDEAVNYVYFRIFKENIWSVANEDRARFR